METEWRWWSARSLMLAGQAEAEELRAADDLLEARRIFREIEAPGWRAQCEADLRARGHRFVMASPRRTDEGLSNREIEVLEQLAAGFTNRQIASRLYLSERTVAHHLQRIFAKLQVKNRTAAVSAATERGLISELTDAAVDGSGGSGRTGKAAAPL
jgi:DNA-binding NarL/FixJ family response regulator